ncbi:hypothetical protein GCM10020001_034880 [Nonomuraea salmonea]
MLVAAHIKRRKDCSNLERRDLANVGMLACLLGCDVLYELGYVGVGEGGLIMISDVIRTAPSLLNHVTGRLSGRTTPWWSPTREKNISHGIGRWYFKAAIWWSSGEKNPVSRIIGIVLSFETYAAESALFPGGRFTCVEA